MKNKRPNTDRRRGIEPWIITHWSQHRPSREAIGAANRRGCVVLLHSLTVLLHSFIDSLIWIAGVALFYFIDWIAGVALFYFIDWIAGVALLYGDDSATRILFYVGKVVYAHAKSVIFKSFKETIAHSDIWECLWVRAWFIHIHIHSYIHTSMHA